MYWFCHTSTCICHGCTCVPHPEPLSHLPPHTIPLGHPSASATSPKLPVSCIEPGLEICFLYDIVHVLMPFSQIIPPLPLPQSPKDCSIHLCLFCCHAYRVVIQFSSVAQSCLTLCDPMNCSTPGLPVHHQLLEFTQTLPSF